MIINKLNDVLGVSGQNIAKIIAENCEYLVPGITSCVNSTFSWESQKLMKFLFELADNTIRNDRSTKEKYINKGKVKRTIVFENMAITFWRTKYIAREEYCNINEKRTVFLLDKRLGIEKYQRLDFDFALKIIDNLGKNYSYQDIANNYKGSGISKQVVYNLIKKFNIDDLMPLILNEPEKKLKHNGIIYVETDDTFKRMITKKGIKTNAITLSVIHTGYVDENKKRKQMANKRYYIQMCNEDGNFNNKKYWKAIKEFIDINYENADKAKILVIGDGAKKIKVVQKYNNWDFALDRFHVAKKIKDLIRGARKYKVKMCNILWEALKNQDFNEFWKYHNFAIKIGKENITKIKCLIDLGQYIKNNQTFIERWDDETYIGCRIEAYVGQIIKVNFRSRPKIFKDITVNKIFWIKQLVLNGHDIFAKLNNERKDKMEDEYRTYKYRFGGHDKKIKNKRAFSPIIKTGKTTPIYSYLKNIMYNY